MGPRNSHSHRFILSYIITDVSKTQNTQLYLRGKADEEYKTTFSSFRSIDLEKKALSKTELMSGGSACEEKESIGSDEITMVMVRAAMVVVKAEKVVMSVVEAMVMTVEVMLVVMTVLYNVGRVWETVPRTLKRKV